MWRVAGLMPLHDAARLLRKPLPAALVDGCPAVRDAALQGLGALLGLLGGAEDAAKDAMGADINAALVSVQVSGRRAAATLQRHRWMRVVVVQLLSGSQFIRPLPRATPQAGLGCNWRARLALARALPALPALVGCDAMHQHWVPYALSLLLTGQCAWPAKRARGCPQRAALACCCSARCHAETGQRTGRMQAGQAACI